MLAHKMKVRYFAKNHDSLERSYGTICGFNGPFRTNNPEGGRTVSRTNSAKNGFLCPSHKFGTVLFEVNGGFVKVTYVY